MTPDSIRRPLLSLGLVLAFIGSSLPLNVGAALAAAGTQVGVVAYDFQSDQLVVPIRGVAPHVVVSQLAARQFIADLHGCELAPGAERTDRSYQTPLAGWSVGPGPGRSGVRVRMIVREDVRPVARFDGAGGRVVFTFERAGAADLAAPVRSTVAVATRAPRLPERPVRPQTVAKQSQAHVKPVAAGSVASVRAARNIEKSLPQRPAAPVPLVLLTQQDGREHAPAQAVKVAGQPAGFPGLAVTHHDRSAEVGGTAMAARRLLSRPERVQPLVLAAAANPLPPRARGKRPQAAARAVAPVARVPKSAPTRANGRARLGLPRFDAQAGRLVVPVVAGTLTAADVSRVKLSKRWSYIDVAGSLPNFVGVRYEERPDFTFQRWVMARRPGQNITRVSFASGVHVQLDVDVTAKAVTVAVVPQETLLTKRPASDVARNSVARRSDPREAFYQTQATLPPGSEPSEDTAEAPAKARPIISADAMLKRNPVPAGVIETRVRRPFYDEERFGLAIPYEGRTPLFRYASKSQDSAVIELKADVLSAAHLQEEARRSLNWGSWKMNRKGRPGVLTLELDFAKPSEVSIAADPERKQLLIIPQPKLSQVAVAEVSAVRSSLSPVQLDQSGEHLFIPFQGQVPRYVIEQVTPTFAYVVFEAAALRDAGVQFQTPLDHPRLNYTLVTQPEGTSTVRLAVCLARPAAAAVFQDPTNTRLVVSIGRDAPVAQSTGPRALQVPQPWPGAVREVPSVPTSALQSNS